MQLYDDDATMSRRSKTKSHQSRLLFLGTSTSVGVPVIGCECATCQSENPRDRRTRSSIFLEGPWGNLLVDTGPDLREQALREKISKVDGVLYTHEHVDHVAGFDELRAFCWNRELPLPLYGSASTIEGLMRMFPWAFSQHQPQQGYVQPDARVFDQTFDFNGLKITPIKVIHGTICTHGFRFNHQSFGSIAYLPDVKSIPTESLDLLQDLSILIIDGLRFESHKTHLSVPEALAVISKIRPNRSILTHLSHELSWEQTNAELPEQVSLAYDGLSLTFP